MRGVLIWFSGGNAAFAFTYAIKGDTSNALLVACIAALGLATAIRRRP